MFADRCPSGGEPKISAVLLDSDPSSVLAPSAYAYQRGVSLVLAEQPKDAHGCPCNKF